MKKTIFATLALGTSITFGGIATNEASADEIDYNKLAEQAKSNSAEVNTKPIQAGNYDFSFSDGEFTYHFYNYNGNFGYEYHSGSTQVDNTVSRLAGEEQTPEQKIDQQQAQFDIQNKQDTKKEVQTTSASVQKETKQPTQSTSSTGGSVAEQIRQAGGDEAMIEIAMRESTMNPNAVNASSGAQGLFQGLGKSWSGGSIAEQTKGAKQYMIDRYGSTSGALAYHNAHNSY
ncbi:transglycosylase [Staphylococcus phage vB_SauM_LM12]|nr:transglycosylase [Staphylococcus phage vB_SauM_LM12]